MTVLPVYRPPNPPARKAAIALLILGGVALLFGVGLIYAGFNLEVLSEDPGLRERLSEIRRQIPVDPKMLFVGYGFVLGLYAVTALMLGLLVRAGGRVVLIFTLAIAALVAMVAAFSAIVTLLSGAIGPAVLPVAVAGVHGMIVRWTIDALGRANAAAPADLAPAPPQRPMAAYYAPPVPPETTPGRIGA